MNAAKNLITASVLLALGVSTGVNAASQNEEDSAYQWGRWAVLSPAAGGETYVAVDTPGADFNARPGDADEFTPNVIDPTDPPVNIDGFCQAGSQCGYATYVKNSNNNVQTAAVPDGFDLSDQDPNGPVLARIDISSTPAQPNTVAPAIAGGGSGPQTAQYTISDTGNPDFPDIQSVQMSNGAGGDNFGGVGTPVVQTIPINQSGDAIQRTTTQISGLDASNNNFQGVDAGMWLNAVETVNQLVTNDPNAIVLPPRTDIAQTGGYFVQGTTATLQQMQAFSAGRVSAIYQGSVLDYGSDVTLQFNFSNNSFQGNFASQNGFNGFNISGNVQGVNFAGQDGANAVTGSFFNAGSNASGAVRNASQLGVFSADHVSP